MTTPAAADTRIRRHRLWSRWLWILAGILAIGSVWSGGRVIHDRRIQRENLRALARDRAVEIATIGKERFDLLVTSAFFPAWSGRGDDRTSLDELTVLQTRRAACRCADTLPISAFFRYDATMSAPFDAATERLIVSTGQWGPQRLADSVLTRVARHAWERAYAAPEQVGFVTVTIDSTLGDQAIVTMSRPYTAGNGTRIFGAILPARALGAALFDHVPRAIPGDTSVGRVVVVRMHLGDSMMHSHSDQRMVRIDTMSLRVSVGDRPLFGTLGDKPYTATVQMAAPLQSIAVTVGISGRQSSMALMMPVAHDRLWMNGVLVLATIIVVLFAIGSSRREVMLARARSDFLAGVSHDLRMPLAQIILAGETLSLRRDRNEADRDALTTSILREARRLATLVENVLLFSRSGAVGLKPNLQPVPVGDLFTEVIDAVHLAVADAGQTIEAHDATGQSVVADRGLIRQALVNLVDNAIKYGKAGQRIRLSSEGASGGRARLLVEDEGPGIPPDQRERLFDPYERLDRDQTSERTGSGLGLAVVRQIILACRGSVRIADGATGGTQIVIELEAATAK